MDAAERESSPRGDITAVHIAKGIGIALIVCGHYVPDDSPAFWRIVHDVVYRFHIPLFFMLSGYLYRGASMARYGAHVRKKIKRLILPYCSIAAIYAVFKLAPGVWFKLGHPVSFESLANVFINPIHSYVPLLWFVYTLFLIFLVFPFLELVIKRRFLIFAVTAALVFVHPTDMFCLYQVSYNMPFFAFGFALSSVVDLGKRHPAWILAALAAAGAAAFVLVGWRWSGFFMRAGWLAAIHSRLTALLGGSTCIICAALLGAPPANRVGGWLASLGRYSMSIYVFHTLFTGSARVLVEQVLPAGRLPFALTTALAVGAGLAGPLVLEKYLFRKSALTRKFLLGLS